MAGNRDAYEEAMRLAFDHSWNRNWKAAIEAYKQALTEFPQDLAATLGLGGVFIELGQPAVAIKVFERAVKLAPEDDKALSSLADAQERLGMLEEAAATHAQIAYTFTQQGKLEEAADTWDRVTRLVPGQVEAHLQLAQILEKLDLQERAATAYATLASITERNGDTDLAIEYCNEALSLDPDNSKAQAVLRSLRSARQPETQSTQPELNGDDIFSFERLAAEEEDVGGHSPLAKARQRALQELADMLFEVGSAGGPEPATAAIIGQAIDQQTRGLFDDAIRSYRKALDSGLNRTAVFFNLGLLFQEQRLYDDAVEAFRHSMRDKEYTLGSHYALGLTYRAAGNIDRSLEHFIEAVKMIDLQAAPPDQVARLNAIYQRLTDSYIAKIETSKANIFTESLIKFFSERDWERKVQDARRRMNSLSEDGDLMTLAEYLETPEKEVIVNAMTLTAEYIQRNMLMTAAEECLRAIQKAPSYLPLHIRLGDIFLKQEHTTKGITKYLTVAEVYQMRGESQQAISIYQKTLHLEPMDVKVRAKLIDLLITRGETDQALEQYLILADIYYQLAQVDRALEKYKEALRLAPSSTKETAWKVDILHRMGDIYNQRVDWVQATQSYQAIVDISPDDERAQLALVDLYHKQGQKGRALKSLDTLLGHYQHAGKTQKILAVLQEAVQTRPEDIGTRARLAAAYAQQGLTKQAIAEYDALGEMQLEAGLREEAIQTIQIIINLGPDDVDGYRHLLSQIKGGSQ